MKIKEIFKNRWYIGGLITAPIALASLVLFAIQMNFIYAAIAICSMLIALYCYYKGKRAVYGGATVSVNPPTEGKINCFCIYTKKKNGIPRAEKIAFENVAESKLIGDRWFFEDIGLWLHVIYNDPELDNEWFEFELPDERYTHPGRLAWVLNQRDYEDFMQLDPTLFEKLKPILMIGANALVLFFIFLMSSKGG